MEREWASHPQPAHPVHPCTCTGPQRATSGGGDHNSNTTHRSAKEAEMANACANRGFFRMLYELSPRSSWSASALQRREVREACKCAHTHKHAHKHVIT